MSKKPETTLKEHALKRLRAIPGSAWEKIQQRTIRGSPDVIGCYHGKMVAIELKTDKGRVDPLQAYKLEMWRLAGALVIVMTPSTIEKDIATILALGHN